jgi:hypothetical protein
MALDLKAEHFRIGSKADLMAPKSNFRFAPESGVESDSGRCPKSAMNDTPADFAALQLSAAKNRRR